MAMPIKFRRGLRENLPATAEVGEPLFTTDTKELYIGTGEGVVPISATDPTLTKRVDEMEKSRSTVTETYTEVFNTLDRIDIEKTTAVVSGGRVRTSKLPEFVEDFSTDKNFDSANSSNMVVDTVNRKATLTPGATGGHYYAKPLQVSDAGRVTIDATVTNSSTMAFSSSERITPDDGIPYVQPMTIVDRTNRTWYFAFQVKSGGGVYMKVLNPDNSVAFEQTIPYISGFYPIEYYLCDVAVDYNNRVWIAVSKTNGGNCNC